MDCNVETKAINKSLCKSNGMTRQIYLSKVNQTLREPVVGSPVLNDISLRATWEDLMKDGTFQMIDVVPIANNSADIITTEVGGEIIKLGDGEKRYDFYAKVATCDLHDLSAYENGYVGKYMYLMNEDKYARGIAQFDEDGVKNGEVKPIKISRVFVKPLDPVNDGAEATTIMITITAEAAQMYDVCDYATKFRYGVLEQLQLPTDALIAGVYDDTTGVTITDESGLILINGSGTEATDGVSFFVDDVAQEGVTFTVTNGVMTTTGLDGNLGADIKVVIDKDAAIWNDDYFGKDFVF